MRERRKRIGNEATKRSLKTEKDRDYLCVKVGIVRLRLFERKIACIATTNEKGVTAYKRKRFSAFTGDLRRLANWLSENACR